jgi:hypothetical protein
MTDQTRQTASLRARSRQWTTWAIGVSALLAGAALCLGHPLYGALCLMASLSLYKNSSLARFPVKATPGIAAREPARQAL